MSEPFGRVLPFVDPDRRLSADGWMELERFRQTAGGNADLVLVLASIAEIQENVAANTEAISDLTAQVVAIAASLDGVIAAIADLTAALADLTERVDALEADTGESDLVGGPYWFLMTSKAA